jgi:hypothetical protein
VIELNEDGGGDREEFIKHSRSGKKSNGLQAPGGLTWYITVRYFTQKNKTPILGLSQINPVDTPMPCFIAHLHTLSFF